MSCNVGASGNSELKARSRLHSLTVAQRNVGVADIDWLLIVDRSELVPLKPGRKNLVFVRSA
jgi:hypothetical protein